LIDLGYDNVIDGSVLTANISSVTSLPGLHSWRRTAAEQTDRI